MSVSEGETALHLLANNVMHNTFRFNAHSIMHLFSFSSAFVESVYGVEGNSVFNYIPLAGC